jgi:sporulation protein YlmC with PRC-barrel domain
MKTMLMTAGLLCSTLLASTAMAQTSTPPAAGQTAGSSAAAPASSGFLTRLSPDTMLVSDLMDQDVIGADNKDIGEIEDVVLDRNGRVVALVVEVDEGIGDRTIALPMSAFQVNTADAATTGSVQGSGQNAGTSAARSSDDMRIMLNMPVDQLKSAPEFDEDD